MVRQSIKKALITVQLVEILLVPPNSKCYPIMHFYNIATAFYRDSYGSFLLSVAIAKRLLLLFTNSFKSLKEQQLYWKNLYFNMAPKFNSYFGGTNNIFVDCRRMYGIFTICSLIKENISLFISDILYL